MGAVAKGRPDRSLLLPLRNAIRQDLNPVKSKTFSSFLQFTLILLGMASTSHSQSFVRNPFLQKGSYNKATICWRVNLNTSLTVRYGTDSTNLSKTSTRGVDSADACITLDSTTLQPSTKYFYEVYNGATRLPGSAHQYFVTSPPIGSKNKYTFWIIGDMGSGDSNQAHVQRGYFKANPSVHVDGFLMLGDNTYPDGTDAEFTNYLFHAYPDVLSNSFSWPTIGNHEVHTNSGAPYLAAFSEPTNGESGGVASGSKLYYSFDYGNIHFIILDSQISSRAKNSPQYLWLQQDLQATRQDWILAYWHHPPYSFGSHNSDQDVELIDMRQNFVPLLEQYGVDMVFAGHSHDYERSYLIDSAYGNSTDNQAKASKVILDPTSGNPDSSTGPYHKRSIKGSHQGAVYMVDGSGGAGATAATLHPVMYRQRSVFGSVILTIQDTVATSKFIDTNGSVQDQFQIVKTRGVTGFERPALKRDSRKSVQFLQMGRRFRFPMNNDQVFRIYSLTGMLVSQKIPTGVWDLDEKTVPSGLYYFRYGTRFGKISIP